MKIHGKYRTSEYRSWEGIIQRCLNPQCTAYSLYGGRGITVCDRWRSFEAFLEDMGQKPTASHTVERIDVNSNYEPTNCRWATKKEQALNTRRNVRLSFEGETLTMKEWAERLNIPYYVVQWRYAQNWTAGRILTPKLRAWNRRST